MKKVMFFFVILVTIIIVYFSYTIIRLSFVNDLYTSPGFVLGVIGAVYVAGFFLGRFFPFVWEKSEEDLKTYDFSHINKKEEKKETETIPLVENLQILIGVDSELESIFNQHQIRTFADIMKHSPETLQSMLSSAGVEKSHLDMESLLEQAHLARDKEWGKLRFLQEKLYGAVHL